MPSPVTTSGFQIQQMPGIQYMDPRLFRPAYGDIVPSITQGAQAGNNLLQIYDQARERPIRQELQQIALDEARANLRYGPQDRALKRQQALLQIEKMSRPYEEITNVGIVEKPRYDPITEVNPDYLARLKLGNMDLGEGGVPVPPTITSTPAGSDAYEKLRVVITDPITGEKRTDERLGKNLSTIEEQQAAVDKNEIAQMALVARKQGTALERNVAALRDAVAIGDIETADLIRQSIKKVPRPTKAEDILNVTNMVQQLMASGSPSDIQTANILQSKLLSPPSAYLSMAAKSGFSPSQTTVLLQMPGGTSAMAKINAALQIGITDEAEILASLTPQELAAVKAARSGESAAPALVKGNEAAALIDSAVGPSSRANGSMDERLVRVESAFSKDGTVPIIKPNTVAGTIPATRVFASEAQAAAARAAGQIEVGDKIIVGGRPGTWQD